MHMFPITSEKLITSDSILFHIRLRHEDRSTILKTFLYSFSARQSLRGNCFGQPKSQINQDPIHLKLTLLDPKYKKTIHILWNEKVQNLRSPISLYTSWISNWLWCWSANHASPLSATVQDERLSNSHNLWFLHEAEISVFGSRTEHKQDRELLLPAQHICYRSQSLNQKIFDSRNSHRQRHHTVMELELLVNWLDGFLMWWYKSLIRQSESELARLALWRSN